MIHRIGRHTEVLTLTSFSYRLWNHQIESLPSTRRDKRPNNSVKVAQFSPHETAQLSTSADTVSWDPALIGAQRGRKPGTCEEDATWTLCPRHIRLGRATMEFRQTRV